MISKKQQICKLKWTIKTSNRIHLYVLNLFTQRDDSNYFRFFYI